MNAEQWAEFIRNNLAKKGLWEPKMPIILHACKTGDAESVAEPFAAKLARLLGVAVTAPSASLWDYPWPFNNYERPTPYKDMVGVISLGILVIGIGLIQTENLQTLDQLFRRQGNESN
ncbi:hypothetical protein ACJBUE_23850 (plasmid) [Ralstonia syzygii subsp. celebesensis]|uniref:hypothetical protein n=1 Tax=Ralstonia syzygii TaxID=28097 RepID=UPI00387E1301